MSVRCSIVMPVYGRAGLTRQCLDAVLADRPLVPFEVIVVDDASPDETRSMLASYGDAIRTVLRTENGGFANACNDGAAAAEGEHLVFLNNDTVPVTGWLDSSSLWQTLTRRPRSWAASCSFRAAQCSTRAW